MASFCFVATKVKVNKKTVRLYIQVLFLRRVQ